MAHVTEKLAEFIFEELSASEMAAAERHLSECSPCRDQVDRFRHTMAMLQTAPDLVPPRSVVFEFEKRPSRRFWQWLPATVAIAALLLLTIALAGRVRVEWHDSQLTIAFGQQAPVHADQTAELAAEIQRLKGNVVYLESRQQAVERNTMRIATLIQPIARQQSPSGD